jgi:hypothetical protein
MKEGSDFSDSEHCSIENNITENKNRCLIMGVLRVDT